MPILIVLFIAVFIIIALFAYQQAKKRRDALAQLAAVLGWSFDPAEDYSHAQRFPQFQIFQRGHDRSAYNTLLGGISIGGRDCPAKMGDYTYKETSGSGKDRHTTTYQFSYLIVDLPYSRATPPLTIRPEGVFDKIAGVFGFDDIDFESAEFSRSFHVKSPDKRFAYDVCHPRMMEFLMAARPPGIHIEGGQCCLSDGSRSWNPPQFQEHVTLIQQFFTLWPDHLKRDVSEQQSGSTT